MIMIFRNKHLLLPNFTKSANFLSKNQNQLFSILFGNCNFCLMIRTRDAKTGMNPQKQNRPLEIWTVL